MFRFVYGLVYLPYVYNANQGCWLCEKWARAFMLLKKNQLPLKTTFSVVLIWVNVLWLIDASVQQ